MNKSYYEILEVDENATSDEIKRSYRRLSMIHHPDKNNNSKESIEKFQEISGAYDVLSDENERRMYNNQKNGINGMNEMNMNFNDVNLNELFSGLFQMGPMGHMGMPPGIRVFYGNRTLFKPPPIIKNIVIPFEQILHDIKVPIEIVRTINDGNIQLNETEIFYIDIPKGIDEGEILVIKDKGNIINNTKGDVKLFIKIENSTKFRRVGLDLIYEHTITLKESLCGFSFKLEYLNGKTYTIINTTNLIEPNYKKIIPNMGVTRENIVGNLVILFNIKFPESLSQEVIDKLNAIDF